MDPRWENASCNDCGKLIRHPKAAAAEHPGTVKGESPVKCKQCADKDRDLRHMAEGTYANGRHSQMLEDALAAAYAQGLLEDTDLAAVSAAKAAAFGLDYAEAHPRTAHAVAQLMKPYMDLLRELGLTPAVRAQAAEDAFTALLEGIHEPS